MLLKGDLRPEIDGRRGVGGWKRGGYRPATQAIEYLGWPGGGVGLGRFQMIENALDRHLDQKIDAPKNEIRPKTDPHHHDRLPRYSADI